MSHEKYMQRCLELAQNGMRAAMPNPSVGAVLVHKGKIIGEGHTSPFGGPHGEVNCINSVKQEHRHLIPDSTLYVSLEPCSHYGKTPPCCDLILQHQIKNIVVGTLDPHEKVSGNGIKKLQQAGKTVTVGVLEKQCRESNQRFFTFHEKKRSYIILKWAESADGFLSPDSRYSNNSVSVLLENNITEKKPIWITNSYSRQLVHKWRSEEHAILVGTQTVIDDNPQLDVRSWTGPNPVRIILDQFNRIDSSYFVKNLKIKTIVLTAQSNLTNLDNLTYETIAFDENLPNAIAGVLYKHNLLSVIIEGGRQTLQTFIDAGLWDEARIFKGETIFNNGTKAPEITGALIDRHSIQQDKLLIYKNYGEHDNI
ncbi:bifunctional diaminohydroxyphosphoribosylaminopyrimidine deaminase/5-amino-6-(5-phosphoribosylamino)uracil reductase RibD [Flavobacterium sp. Sd200]|uniref:bifunctional diaminohydroxyphosphoribosylaminopyrimidine deaminase/5-amino-6-(5-phosphoribosylamino)uracil reductase RibD n=1 Tax=Flavobacterium sp. Sd200 TaxID=2692211 RepID=UPI00136A8FB8|nr:bifunctional diaminohydroxyphosphoribosylaminopyrimidine deaminase/5-amino-6-(5-phosphoribosylamino)uracil reductase RibD [Flavobacterium sp. Sd200]MXN90662.1 bifunctional diaminohydroxyphosphoribosylaminopyrimidine deaminase/5-amino-6-(5-phosphoribosylamino)uracil reductase RibD [Flavobacterium sp. Sd200]